MHCSVMFLLNNYSVVPSFVLQGIYDVCITAQNVKVFDYIGFGWLQVLGWHNEKAGDGCRLFLILFLVLSSSLPQSEDNPIFPGQSLPNGMNIAQYYESSATFVVAVGEGGEGVDGVFIS